MYYREGRPPKFSLRSTRRKDLQTIVPNEISLDEDVYERLVAAKFEEETFSEAIERLLDRCSLLELEGLWEEAEVEEMREAIDAAEAAARRDIDAVVDRFDQE